MLLQPAPVALSWEGVGHTEIAVGFWRILSSGEKCDAQLQERCGWPPHAVCWFSSVFSGMPVEGEINKRRKGERREHASVCPAPRCYLQVSVV